MQTAVPLRSPDSLSRPGPGAGVAGGRHARLYNSLAQDVSLSEGWASDTLISQWFSN